MELLILTYCGMELQFTNSSRFKMAIFAKIMANKRALFTIPTLAKYVNLHMK